MGKFSDLTEKDKKEAENFLLKITEILDSAFPESEGWNKLFVIFKDPKKPTYGTDCSKPKMIESLRFLADTLENEK